jgi:Holliday junction resolvasome RuvABC endonuclease subunit
MTHLVIGLDPGFATFGFAVLAIDLMAYDSHAGVGPKATVVGMGVLTSKKDPEAPKVDDNVRRCSEFARQIENILAGRQPDARKGVGVEALFPEANVSVVCAEAMSFPRSSSVAAKMAMTWGVIVANVVRRNLAFRQLAPQAVKLSVVGTKDASKLHVERVLVKRWGPQIRRHLKGYRRGLHEHAYDALAVATACLDAET